jgi:hypothetical protein
VSSDLKPYPRGSLTPALHCYGEGFILKGTGGVVKKQERKDEKNQRIKRARLFYSKELNHKSSDPYHGSGSERSAEGYLKGATNMFVFIQKLCQKEVI